MRVIISDNRAVAGELLSAKGDAVYKFQELSFLCASLRIFTHLCASLRIFAPNYDKLKLWGALVLFVAYLIALPQAAFCPRKHNIYILVLFNVLFDFNKAQPFNFKSILISLICSYGVKSLIFI
ncbi:MAG: hypothetical protein II948_03225 [Synergistaceae bacterium]|nr:hypothetical protein [Synergistaceae bacterium]